MQGKPSNLPVEYSETAESDIESGNPSLLYLGLTVEWFREQIKNAQLKPA